MQNDPIEKLRKHYRSAWKGTIAGFVFIALLILFVGEVSFSELFVGPRILRRVAFNLAFAGGFLGFLILNDRENVDIIDRIRLPLMVGVTGYFLWFWLLGLTNRINREDYTYNESLTVERIMLRYQKDAGAKQKTPSHWSLKIKDQEGRIASFDGPLDEFDANMLGKQITLSIVRGRWSQDFIAPFE